MNNKIDTKCLNSLRFFAAFIIAFIEHYKHFANTQISLFDNILEVPYHLGGLMVEFFFVLSGFCMFLGYAKKIQNKEINFKDYISRRLRKIYPLFFLTLILATILELWHYNLTSTFFIYSDFSPWFFATNILLCQCGIFGTQYTFNGPAWFISVCFLMYIIFYIVVHFAKDKKAIVYTFIGIALIGSYILLGNISYPVLLNAEVGRGLLSFSIGVILANIFLISDKLNTKFIGIYSLLIIITLCCTYMEYFYVFENMQMFFILVITPLVFFSALYTPWLNKLLSIKTLLYLGSLSMEIYLFHFPIQCIIKNCELTFKLHPNYTSCYFWLFYIVITLIFVILYKHFIKEKYENLFIQICKRFLKNQQ